MTSSPSAQIFPPTGNLGSEVSVWRAKVWLLMTTPSPQSKEGDDVDPDVLNVTDFRKVCFPLDSTCFLLLDPQHVSGAVASFLARGEDCSAGPPPAPPAARP